MVHCINKRRTNKVREAESRCAVDMNQVSLSGRIFHRPGGMGQRFQVGFGFTLQGPLLRFKEMAAFNRDRGFPVRIEHHVYSFSFEAGSQIGEEQLCSPIFFRRHCDERRSYECNFHENKKAYLMKMPNRGMAFYYGVTTATLLTPLHAR